MTRIIGPTGKPFYLPPSSQARQSWQMARQSARLESNIAHAQQSIARSNQPFRPPGSTGQTVAPDGSVTTFYGNSGSKTVSPSGRTTLESGTASPWRRGVQPQQGNHTAARLRAPSSYAPAPTVDRPAIAPVRPRGVPKLTRALPKGAGRISAAGAASGVANGVVAGASTLLYGGSISQAVGAGVGGAIGSVAGGAIGALNLSIGNGYLARSKSHVKS